MEAIREMLDAAARISCRVSPDLLKPKVFMIGAALTLIAIFMGSLIQLLFALLDRHVTNPVRPRPIKN